MGRYPCRGRDRKLNPVRELPRVALPAIQEYQMIADLVKRNILCTPTADRMMHKPVDRYGSRLGVGVGTAGVLKLIATMLYVSVPALW